MFFGHWDTGQLCDPKRILSILENAGQMSISFFSSFTDFNSLFCRATLKACRMPDIHFAVGSKLCMQLFFNSCLRPSNLNQRRSKKGEGFLSKSPPHCRRATWETHYDNLPSLFTHAHSLPIFSLFLTSTLLINCRDFRRTLRPPVKSWRELRKGQGRWKRV